MIIQNKKRGNYEFGVGGSGIRGGGVEALSWRWGFSIDPPTIFFDPGQGSVNEVGGVTPPPQLPCQNEHCVHIQPLELKNKQIVSQHTSHELH